MSDLQTFLSLIDSDKVGAKEIAGQAAQKLESKQVTLIDIVQSLGEYINDEDATVRSGTIRYLAHIIRELPQSFLSRQQLQVLCQFFCDRIEDEGAVGGLYHLQGLERYNKDMAAMTFRAMVKHFLDLRIHPQAQRLQILELLNALMSNHRSVLKAMAEESLTAIVELVNGEKDPRNLMIIFSVLKVIMIEWDISSHAEMLLDSVFCYFPVTFRPPPNDPYGVTAQDLKGRLRDCIAASDQFAPFVFPQLIDKLDSTSANVKKDVLQTIALCASSYGVEQLSNHAITLWDSLKYEILNPQEEDLAQEALLALQAIAFKLSYRLTSTNQTTALARYLRPITKECNEQLQEPQHKLAKPAGQILSSLSKASVTALYLVTKAVMPFLLTLYQAAETISKKRALLEVLNNIFESAIAVHTLSNILVGDAEIQNPLGAFKDRLFELASQALMSTTAEEVSFRVVAMRLLLHLCSLPNYLEENEIGMVVQYLDGLALSEDSSGRDDVRKEAIHGLADISKIRPNLIMNLSFPEFMARLPESNTATNSDYMVVLEGLARLSVEKTISETLIRRLLSKLDLVMQNNDSSTYPHAILSTLLYVLSKRSLIGDPSVEFYLEKIVIGQTSRVVLSSMGKAPLTALNEDLAMDTLGRLVNTVVRATPLDKQRLMSLNIYSLFTDKSIFTPIPQRQDSPKQQRITMVLSTWLMAGIRPGVPLGLENVGFASIEVLLDRLVKLALDEDVPKIRSTILKQIALITNKFLQLSEIHYATNLLWDSSKGLLEARTLTENSIRIIFWIAKGLILRLANTEEVLQRLMDLLSNTVFGLTSGRGFGVLLAPDEILSKENGATIRLLAKQKVFNLCIPRIAKDIRLVETSMKPNYLSALAGILQHVPTEIFIAEIDVLLPLLLQSLDLKDADVKATTIESLIIISQENAKSTEQHMTSLVNRLLRCSANEETNSSRVRLNALRCLRVFPRKMKDSTLSPLRSRVINHLMTALDDPKRSVRKEAVECRAEWFHMDDPEDG